MAYQLGFKGVVSSVSSSLEGWSWRFLGSKVGPPSSHPPTWVRRSMTYPKVKDFPCSGVNRHDIQEKWVRYVIHSISIDMGYIIKRYQPFSFLLPKPIVHGDFLRWLQPTLTAPEADDHPRVRKRSKVVGLPQLDLRARNRPFFWCENGVLPIRSITSII